MNRSTSCLSVLFVFGALSVSAAEWETVEPKGEPIARHEAGFVELGGKFYLLGGRRIQPVSIYDPSNKEWTQGSAPPMEFHHFQPVVLTDRILIVCAMTGKFPTETGLERALVYFPGDDRWEWSHRIPVERRRGGAGVSLHEGKVYISGGIVNGHMGGYVNWFDEYDPETGAWKRLPDAPNRRDHFQSAIVDAKLYCAGGRTTSKETNQVFELTVPEVDVYDFSTEEWSVLTEPLPTPRAGSFTLGLEGRVVVLGGESGQKLAHSEVEAWSLSDRSWIEMPSLNRGRHGTGAILWQDFVYTCSGSGNRGGSPELKSMERLHLD